MAKWVPGRAREKPLDPGLRTELWQAHKDIYRNVKTLVPPYPFSGQPMRFQDELTALQIFADGRFSFVVMETENTSKGFDCHINGDEDRRLVSFEGTCCPLSAAHRSWQTEAGAVLVGGVDGAMAEGRATVRAEVRIEGGRAKLVDVEQAIFSFEVLLAPMHSPTQALIRPPLGRNSPFASAPSWKRWCLPYVDKGPLDADAHWHPRRMEAQLKIERRKDRVTLDKKIQRLKSEADERRRLPPIAVA